MVHGEDDTALRQLVTRLLDREPDNIPALLIQSGVLLLTQRADLAIPVLNHVLSLTNSPNARLKRARAYAQARNYAAARSDYLALESSTSNHFLAEYGLAQLAELQHDTNQVIHYLKLCLSNAPPDTVQWREVRARLDLFQPSPVGVKKL